MATNIEICTNALLLLGDSAIASLEENTDRARRCASIYPQARRDVLRSHPWNCLVRRVQLAPMAQAPAFGWNQQFAVPGNLLRLLDVSVNRCQVDFEYEDRKILANATVLNVRYLADLPESGWDSNLTDIMIKRMVKDLAYPITKSTSLAQLKAQEFEVAWKRAKSVDGQENPPEDFASNSPFLEARL